MGRVEKIRGHDFRRFRCGVFVWAYARTYEVIRLQNSTVVQNGEPQRAGSSFCAPQTHGTGREESLVEIAGSERERAHRHGPPVPSTDLATIRLSRRGAECQKLCEPALCIVGVAEVEAI